MVEETPVILVADDDADILHLVTTHLRGMHAHVLEASDGEMALTVARRELPDLMILDVMMPGKSGWEVCKEVRDDDLLRHTGVIVLTGIGEKLNELTSPLYGADECIDKPFEFPELDFKVRKVLSDRRRKREHEGHAHPRAGKATAATPAPKPKADKPKAAKKAAAKKAPAKKAPAKKAPAKKAPAKKAAAKKAPAKKAPAKKAAAKKPAAAAKKPGAKKPAKKPAKKR